MGQAIDQTSFCDAEHIAFRERLRQETLTLKKWFDDRRFDCDARPNFGVELEGWLVDHNCLPSPQSEAFLEAANDPDIVEELSQFNFEVNAPPQAAGPQTFSNTQSDLDETWRRCEIAAAQLGLRPAAMDVESETLPCIERRSNGASSRQRTQDFHRRARQSRLSLQPYYA